MSYETAYYVVSTWIGVGLGVYFGLKAAIRDFEKKMEDGDK